MKSAVITFTILLSAIVSSQLLAQDSKPKTTEEKISEKTKAQWLPPEELLKDFDWIKLTSEEWVKGDIIAMYDEEMDFDSDNFGLIQIDMDDIALIISDEVQSLQLNDGRLVVGKIRLDGNDLTLTHGKVEQHVQRQSILSIAASGEGSKIDFWSGKVSFGMDIREGNTNQKDLLTDIRVERRTAKSRLTNSYVANYSEVSEIETVKNQRFNSDYDWFFTHRLFWRVGTYEYFSDDFQNIDTRQTISSELGYAFIDASKLNWEVFGGPGYQTTKFISVEAGEDEKENTMIATGGTLLEWEVTKDIDYVFDYNVQLVSTRAGKLIHHLKTGLSIDLLNDLDLELMYYWDRVQDPVADDTGEIPDPDDARFSVGVGYEF